MQISGKNFPGGRNNMGKDPVVVVCLTCSRIEDRPVNGPVGK